MRIGSLAMPTLGKCRPSAGKGDSCVEAELEGERLEARRPSGVCWSESDLGRGAGWLLVLNESDNIFWEAFRSKINRI